MIKDIEIILGLVWVIMYIISVEITFIIREVFLKQNIILSIIQNDNYLTLFTFIITSNKYWKTK